MQGAREYAKLIPTGQYGRLYCMSGRHARGTTFYIYVLPKGENAISTEGSLSLTDAVEVFGIIGGNPGWSECYGWLHQGKWQEDFRILLESKKKEYEQKRVEEEARKIDAHREEQRREIALLGNY